jgi:hypothetical protein
MLRAFASLFLLSAIAWPQTCVPTGPLRPADSITGTLDDGGCRLSDGSAFRLYILTLPTFGQLQFNVASDDFPATAILRDSQGRMVAGGAAISQTIEHGEYALLINSQSPGQFGSYSVTSAFTPEPNTLCRDIARIGPTAMLSGRLVSTSCRQQNNTPYDGYLISVLGSGALTVTLASPNFSGQVTIRDSEGRVAATDPISATAQVDGDNDYTVIVAGAGPEALGDYQLSAAFTPSDGETCRSQGALTGGQTVHGTIGQGSCAFGSSLLYQYYDLNVPADGLADLRVTPSADTDMLVAILDRYGRLVSQDLESGGIERPILRQQLSAGAYQALVISQTEGGQFSLLYNFYPGPAATCPALVLTSGAPQSGSLEGVSSCRGQNSMQDTYTFAIASPGTVDITLSSDDFDGSLLLMDGKNNNLTQNDASGNQNAHIVANLPAGSYSIAALSEDPGNYSIAYNFTPHTLAACPPPQTLGLSNGFIGVLGAASCAGPDGQPADWYQFTTASDSTVALFMTSTNINSYLTLTDAQGNVLRRDDDSYGDTDSMIVQWLPAGTYLLGASASGGSQSGQYQVDTLSVDGPRTPGCLPLDDLRTGTTQGSLYITSCQYRDDTFADVYRVQVVNSGILDVEMDSDSLDAYLVLTDPNGNVVDLDDDSAGGNNAHLTTSVDVGTYYLVAKSYVQQGYVTGPYVLIVK